MNNAIYMVVLIFSILAASSYVSASEPNAHDVSLAYRMTLQIMGGVASCGDEWSRPEYYATASRRDPAVEQELEGVRIEIGNVKSRLNGFDERMAPLLPREHSNVPLTEEETAELESLRSRRQELQLLLEQQDRLGFEQRSALVRERSDIDRSLRLLENSIPLNEEETRFLMDQREQRAPLDARRNDLESRDAELTALITMSTPGSLRVYANDDLRLKLMESDAFEDDTCATWALTLDQETLSQGGIELENGGRPLLRLWIQPDRFRIND